jgi:hypothetical protein
MASGRLGNRLHRATGWLRGFRRSTRLLPSNRGLHARRLAGGQRRQRLVLSVGADVRSALGFALEALDWAIRKEFSDLCLGRSTHTLAQKSEGPV